MINRFRGENFYLSNMFPLKNWIQTNLGIAVPTSEHVYMANRFIDPEIQRVVARARGDEDDISPYKDGKAAKKLAHEYLEAGAVQVPEWEVAKLGVMYQAVKRKFDANLTLALQLCATGDEELIEGNTWNDTF